jgi:hypothetical protein
MGIVMVTVGLLVGTGLGGIACVGAAGAASGVAVSVALAEAAGDVGPEASSDASGPVVSSHPARQATNARIAGGKSIDARLMGRF